MNAAERFTGPLGGGPMPAFAFDKDGVANITPEDNWRMVWHDGCRSPMKRLNEWLDLDDGNRIRLWECTGCGARLFAGLDARRYVVRRPA